MVVRGGTPAWIRVLRIAFAILGLVALAWIPLRNLGNPNYSYVNFFSYFTIQSNILGLIVLVVGGLKDPAGRRWQVLRGAATLYLTITLIIYAVLLADIDVQLTERWINDTLHRVIPIVLIADWLLVAAALKPTVKLILGWLIYPLAYGAYTLVRGPFADWYPYPFIDPREQGYGALTIGLVVMAVVFAILGVIVAALNGLVPKAVARR
ncbi:Pr6Pr family membrane protein [Nocardia tengchongensis]|uniref:Pr6Pr family membrane protein n=1 Tax=Nocardia tengchongensis TaxID=2055889 RepID=A0ABX8CMG1_9NOCA|nr:Pr6Pr family membrane protein [Nocardia tengchongensis]QVI20547.1 Pr6Pr family membrane protein [Nocardia tengchongensis]